MSFSVKEPHRFVVTYNVVFLSYSVVAVFILNDNFNSSFLKCKVIHVVSSEFSHVGQQIILYVAEFRHCFMVNVIVAAVTTSITVCCHQGNVIQAIRCCLLMTFHNLLLSNTVTAVASS